MAVATPPRTERFTITPQRYRLLAEVTLVLLTLIVLTGAAVRLTGSGLGCPDWPRCGGKIIPELDTHIAIEFGNRVLSGLIGLPCLALGFLVFRLRPFRPDLVRPALLVAGGVLAQGLLGGATVRADLDWPFVMSHYLLALAMLVAAAVLVWRARRAPGAIETHPRAVVAAVRALVLVGALIIVLGTLATAAGPHAGGAGTGDVIDRLDAFGNGTLRGFIRVHGHIAAVWGGLFVALFLYARTRATPGLLKAIGLVCVLIAVQGIIGLIQYHSALPAEVVWAHASLAAVLWLGLLWSWLAAGRTGG